MGAGQAAVDKVSKGLRKGFQFLAAQVKALRRAVRVDNFRLAQRLRRDLPCICGTSKNHCGMTLSGWSGSADYGYATSVTVTGPSGTSNE